MSTLQALEFALTNNLNVLLKGRHGVGKTHMVIDLFQRKQLKYMYFSAATMDPWVDFIGIPKEAHDEKGQYLEIIRPKVFRDDEVEALFFDEFNRAPSKVRNAVMELIQFKSINGRKFNNLKVIWTAINPDDDQEESYDVERLDGAQTDRFQLQLDIPYEPFVPYFKEKFGNLGIIGTNWWASSNKETQRCISPRRLEYLLDTYKNGGDLKWIAPSNVNITQLQALLMEEDTVPNKMAAIFRDKDTIKGQEFLMNENNFEQAINLIANSPEYQEFFIPLMIDEKLFMYIGNPKICPTITVHITGNLNKFDGLLRRFCAATPRKEFGAALLKTLEQTKPPATVQP